MDSINEADAEHAIIIIAHDQADVEVLLPIQVAVVVVVSGIDIEYKDLARAK